MARYLYLAGLFCLTHLFAIKTGFCFQKTTTSAEDTDTIIVKT